MTVTTCFPSVLMQVHRQGQYILRSVGESLGWKEVSLPSDPICESLMCGYEKYYSMSMPMFADFLLETDPEFYKYLTRNNEKMNQVSKDHPNFSSLYLANVIQKMVNRGDIVEELEYFGPDREKYCRLPTDPPMKYSALRKIGGINRKYSKKRILLDYLFDNGDSRGTKLLALFPTKKNRKKIARGPVCFSS